MEHTSIQISAAYTGTAHHLQVTHVLVYNEFMSLHFKQFLSQALSVLKVKPHCDEISEGDLWCHTLAI